MNKRHKPSQHYKKIENIENENAEMSKMSIYMRANELKDQKRDQLMRKT
jgi:hypothetical protein